MLYFHLTPELTVDRVASNRRDVMAICNASDTGAQWARQPGQPGLQTGWINRTDVDTLEQATYLAASATQNLGRPYLATDSGPRVSPRFGVIEAPRVGDECSRGFNGDYYPVGKIVAITPESFRVITTEGPRGRLKFYRRGQSGAWVQAGGTWSLVSGVRNDQNPEF